MRDKKTFRVDHSTGYVEVNVGEFFGAADKRKISRFLNLAKQHCTKQQGEELSAAIKVEIDARKQAIDEMAVLRDRIYSLGVRIPYTYERALERQCERLAEMAKLVENKKAGWLD